MKSDLIHRLKVLLIELLVIVGLPIVFAGYLATIEYIVIVAVYDIIEAFNKSTPGFLNLFSILLIPNFIVLHIEFAHKYKEYK